MSVAAVLVALCCASNASAAWPNFGGNSQHTGVSATASQALNRIMWSTPVDETAPAEPILIHYGSPLISAANTVIIPVKTTIRGDFRLDARRGADGSLIWSASTDYVLPPHGFVPSYSPALSPDGRVWYPGAGGTLLFRDNVDAATPNATGKRAFYGLAAYQGAQQEFDTKVFVNTPITTDSNGTLYFGFRALPDAPMGLASGIARIDSAGNGSWVAASQIAGHPAATVVPHQAAPALSNDQSTLYVSVSNQNGDNAYLAGLDPATLAVRNVGPGVPMRVALKDPRAGGINNAFVSDSSTASPMVGPDGDVYYGVFGNPYNGSRGWLLHYSANLQQTKTPGAFGWDTTPAVVPREAVPSYNGPSSYLLFTKYNDYAGGDGGLGVNRIAILDPNQQMAEWHPSSNGLPVMREILLMTGPTPDEDLVLFYPEAVKEWCINAAAVDPITKAVMVNSEDGNLYRWDLTSNTLSESVRLSKGVLEAYTSTLVGPDGTVYATNQAILNAVGSNAVVRVARTGTGTGNVTSGNGNAVACGPTTQTCGHQFPPGAAVSLTATPDAESIFTGWLGPCTGRGTCEFAAQHGVTAIATFAPASVAPLRYDLDGNGAYDALTDGLVAIRYLFGLTGPAMVSGAVGPGATRTDPAAIRQHLDDIRPLFDIDGNGRADALTDGLLLMRYLFGLRGPALMTNVIDAGATRTTASAVEGYIESLLP